MQRWYIVHNRARTVVKYVHHDYRAANGEAFKWKPNVQISHVEAENPADAEKIFLGIPLDHRDNGAPPGQELKVEQPDNATEPAPSPPRGATDKARGDSE